MADNIHYNFEMPAPPEHLKKEAEVFVTNAKGFGAVVARWTHGPVKSNFHAEFAPGNAEGFAQFAKWVENSVPGMSPATYSTGR